MLRHYSRRRVSGQSLLCGSGARGGVDNEKLRCRYIQGTGDDAGRVHRAFPVAATERRNHDLVRLGLRLVEVETC